MKKKFSKFGSIILSVLLACSLLTSLVGCGNKQPDAGNQSSGKDDSYYHATTSDAEIWTAPASQKIMASQPVSYYNDVKTNIINMSAVKNEYETAQVIVTANNKDLKYVVSVSDLVHTTDTNAVISSDNCNIYTQYYLFVANNLHRNGAPTGEYPDAIVPQENAIEHDLNIVKKGNSGGAWLEFYIPKTAKAGTYTGTATVNLGNGQVNVPINLKVYDVELSDENTSKSLFTINGNMVKQYELDSSIEMYDKYAELLIKHRLAPTGMMNTEVTGEEKYEDYADRVYKFYQMGCRTASLPTSATSEGGRSIFDKEYTGKCILALAEKSIEIGVDLVALTAFYDYMIDEPFGGYLTMDTVDFYIQTFNEMIAEVEVQAQSIEGIETEIGQKVLASISKVPHIVTDFIDNVPNRRYPVGGWNDDFYDGKNVTLCCPFDGYTTQAQRDRYAGLPTDELWFYGCNSPSYPYPSYHIDDTLVSTASVGWMMADYGVTGNLYWVVNYYMAAGSTTRVEEPYKLADTNVGSNGEGTIIYPGKPFGVDGPISSIRLSAILDGQEDFELIKALQTKYQEAGLSADSILNRVTANLYSGVTVSGGTQEYEEARETLLSLLEVASSDGQMMITNAVESENSAGMKNYEFTVRVAEGTELYENGVLLTNGVGGVYTVNKQLTEASNYLSLKAVKNGNSASMSLYLGGKQEIYVANQFIQTDFSGTYASGQLSGDYWRFAFDSNDAKRELVFKHSSVLGISEKTASFIIEANNFSADEISYTIYVKYSKFGRVEFSTGTLLAGKNEIVLDSWVLSNWKRNGTVEQISIELDKPSEIGIAKFKIYGV